MGGAVSAWTRLAAACCERERICECVAREREGEGRHPMRDALEEVVEDGERIGLLEDVDAGPRGRLEGVARPGEERPRRREDHLKAAQASAPAPPLENPRVLADDDRSVADAERAHLPRAFGEWRGVSGPCRLAAVRRALHTRRTRTSRVVVGSSQFRPPARASRSRAAKSTPPLSAATTGWSAGRSRGAFSAHSRFTLRATATTHGRQTHLAAPPTQHGQWTIRCGLSPLAASHGERSAWLRLESLPRNAQQRGAVRWREAILPVICFRLGRWARARTQRDATWCGTPSLLK